MTFKITLKQTLHDWLSVPDQCQALVDCPRIAGFLPALLLHDQHGRVTNS